MNIMRYADCRIMAFLDEQKAEKATSKAKENLKKVSKELDKVKDKKKQPIIKKIKNTIVRLLKNPLVEATAVLGIISLIHNLAIRRETDPTMIEARRLARMRERNREFGHLSTANRPGQNAATNRAEQAVIQNAQAAAQAAQNAAQEAQTARERSIVEEMNATKSKPWVTNKIVKHTGHPSRESFGSSLLNKTQNHASIEEIKGMKTFHPQSNNRKVSFGQDLLNKIKSHASSKLFRYSKPSGKFGEEFFKGGYGKSMFGQKMASPSDYKGPVDQRYARLGEDIFTPDEIAIKKFREESRGSQPEKKSERNIYANPSAFKVKSVGRDDGYLIRTYDTMPWALEDAERRKEKAELRYLLDTEW